MAMVTQVVRFKMKLLRHRVGKDPDSDYTNWDSIDSQFSLSAWEQIGGGFEQEVATIGQCLTLLSLHWVT